MAFVFSPFHTIAINSMIGRLTGKLAAKNPPQIVIDVQGVGYEVDVPMSTFYNLPDLGGSLTLLTHLAIREDGHFLYGFASEDERFAFRQLLKISGIGARTALSVLSGLSVGDLAAAVAEQETGRLLNVPGIGKKTAERLLLELKGKLPGALPGVGGKTAAMPSVGNDIINALLSLGYNTKEADHALKSLPENIDTAEGIRLALKGLSKV